MKKLTIGLVLGLLVQPIYTSISANQSKEVGQIRFEQSEVRKLAISDEIRFKGAARHRALIQKNRGTDKNGKPRDELQIYSSGDAYGDGSKGSGIHLYGNEDPEHDGNIAFLTGPNNKGAGRMIISERGNVTVGRTSSRDHIFNFVDKRQDHGLLTLKNPRNQPAILFVETNSSEGELAVPSGEVLSLGHYDRVGKKGKFTSRLEVKGDGAVSVLDKNGASVMMVETAGGFYLSAPNSGTKASAGQAKSLLGGLTPITLADGQMKIGSAGLPANQSVTSKDQTLANYQSIVAALVKTVQDQEKRLKALEK